MTMAPVEGSRFLAHATPIAYSGDRCGIWAPERCALRARTGRRSPASCNCGENQAIKGIGAFRASTNRAAGAPKIRGLRGVYRPVSDQAVAVRRRRLSHAMVALARSL